MRIVSTLSNAIASEYAEIGGIRNGIRDYSGSAYLISCRVVGTVVYTGAFDVGIDLPSPPLAKVGT
jgi:hypothetical protein